MKKTVYSVVALVPALTVFVGLAAVALAQMPELPPGDEITLTEIALRIQQVANFVVVVSGIIVTAYIIIAGIRWTMAGADTTKVESAKQALVAGLWGAAIVLGSGVIINTVFSLVTRSFFGGFFH